MVSKDKLSEGEQGREEPNLTPSLDIIGKHFETLTVSAQQTEQQVERTTQSSIALEKLHRMFQDFLTNEQGFIPSPLNSAFLARRRYQGSMISVLIDSFLK